MKDYYYLIIISITILILSKIFKNNEIFSGTITSLTPPTIIEVSNLIFDGGYNPLLKDPMNTDSPYRFGNKSDNRYLNIKINYIGSTSNLKFIFEIKNLSALDIPCVKFEKDNVTLDKNNNFTTPNINIISLLKTNIYENNLRILVSCVNLSTQQESIKNRFIKVVKIPLSVNLNNLIIDSHSYTKRTVNGINYYGYYFIFQNPKDLIYNKYYVYYQHSKTPLKDKYFPSGEAWYLKQYNKEDLLVPKVQGAIGLFITTSLRKSILRIAGIDDENNIGFFSERVIEPIYQPVTVPVNPRFLINLNNNKQYIYFALEELPQNSKKLEIKIFGQRRQNVQLKQGLKRSYIEYIENGPFLEIQELKKIEFTGDLNAYFEKRNINGKDYFIPNKVSYFLLDINNNNNHFTRYSIMAINHDNSTNEIAYSNEFLINPAGRYKGEETDGVFVNYSKIIDNFTNSNNILVL
jgi:hypothetical protein